MVGAEGRGMPLIRSKGMETLVQIEALLVAYARGNESALKRAHDLAEAMLAGLESGEVDDPCEWDAANGYGVCMDIAQGLQSLDANGSYVDALEEEPGAATVLEGVVQAWEQW